MTHFIQKLIAQALALLVVTYIIPGITVTGILPLIVAAFCMGLVNAIVRPLLLIFTFPITVVTLGLFILVINGACFALVAWLVKGFMVDGMLAAILGALAMSVVGFFLNWMIVKKD